MIAIAIVWNDLSKSPPSCLAQKGSSDLSTDKACRVYLKIGAVYFLENSERKGFARDIEMHAEIDR